SPSWRDRWAALIGWAPTDTLDTKDITRHCSATARYEPTIKDSPDSRRTSCSRPRPRLPRWWQGGLRRAVHRGLTRRPRSISGSGRAEDWDSNPECDSVRQRSVELRARRVHESRHPGTGEREQKVIHGHRRRIVRFDEFDQSTERG